MAQELKRGCGFRKVHGLYLVGEYVPVSCDRLPYRIAKCPYCNQGIKFPRNPTLLDPTVIFGSHEGCHDEHRPCIMCDPTHEPAYLLGVGSEYTPQSFTTEAILQGVSKRIHAIPKKLVLGKTVVYLCHNKACDVPDENPDKLPLVKDANGTALEQPRMVEAPKTKKALGIFSAFIPQRIEMLFYEKEITEKLKEKMAKRGITIVSIPTGDLDHAPAKLRKKLLKKERQSQQPPPPPARDSKGHFIKTRRKGG